MDTTTAAETLDAIRLGGQRMMLAARGRMTELSRALDEGRFNEAMTYVGELQHLIGPLATAEARMMPFHDTHLVRASETAIGMKIKAMGTIESREVETTPCMGGDHEHTVITLHFEGNPTPMQVNGSDELLALNEPD